MVIHWFLFLRKGDTLSVKIVHKESVAKLQKGCCWNSDQDLVFEQRQHSLLICHGSNKFVMNMNNNETEVHEDQLEEYALKKSVKDFACRSKTKAKSERRERTDSSPRIVSIERRNWIDIESGKYSFSEYEVPKKVTFLLRHSQ